VVLTAVEKTATGASQDNHKIDYTIFAHSREREVMERFALEPDALGAAIETSSYSREWIRRSVLASSGGAELVAPADIRSEIQRAAQSLLDRYTSQ